MSRVLVIDDEAQITRAVCGALRRDGHEALEALDGAAGLELAATRSPDVVIVDLGLPDMDGVELVRSLQGWYDGLVIVLSGATQIETRVSALDAGADDFISKPFGMAELQARLRAHERRVAGLSATREAVHHFDGLVVDLAGRRLQVGDSEVSLTPTEWRILEAMVQRPGQLLTHGHLLRECWDASYGGETRQALRVHVSALRAKLDDDAQEPRFIKTESGAGYRWLPVPAADGPEPTQGAAPVRTGASDAQPGPRDHGVVHGLANVLTSISFASYRARTTPEEADQFFELLDAKLAEASRLLDELVDPERPEAGPGPGTDVDLDGRR